MITMVGPLCGTNTWEYCNTYGTENNGWCAGSVVVAGLVLYVVPTRLLGLFKIVSWNNGNVCFDWNDMVIGLREYIPLDTEWRMSTWPIRAEKDIQSPITPNEGSSSSTPLGNEDLMRKSASRHLQHCGSSTSKIFVCPDDYEYPLRTVSGHIRTINNTEVNSSLRLHNTNVSPANVSRKIINVKVGYSDVLYCVKLVMKDFMGKFRTAEIAPQSELLDNIRHSHMWHEITIILGGGATIMTIVPMCLLGLAGRAWAEIYITYGITLLSVSLPIAILCMDAWLERIFRVLSAQAATDKFSRYMLYTAMEKLINDDSIDDSTKEELARLTRGIMVGAFNLVTATELVKDQPSFTRVYQVRTDRRNAYYKKSGAVVDTQIQLAGTFTGIILLMMVIIVWNVMWECEFAIVDDSKTVRNALASTALVLWNVVLGLVLIVLSNVHNVGRLLEEELFDVILQMTGKDNVQPKRWYSISNLHLRRGIVTWYVRSKNNVGRITLGTQIQLLQTGNYVRTLKDRSVSRCLNTEFDNVAESPNLTRLSSGSISVAKELGAELGKRYILTNLPPSETGRERYAERAVLSVPTELA
jgi:hypothetical protein